jgi:adenylate cyclase
LLIALLAAIPPRIGAPGLERISLLLFDQYQRWQPRAYQDVGVRVIDIDEETIRRFGQWPWARTEIALLTDRLAEAGAAAIAYDIVFSEPDRTSPARIARQPGIDPATARVLAGLPDNDRLLAQSIAKAPVVLGQFLTNDPYRRSATPKAGFAVSGRQPTGLSIFANVIPPLAALDQAAAGTGFVTFKPGSDGIVRSPPLVARVGDQLLPSLSLEALRVAQGAGGVVLKTDEASGEIGGSGDMVSLKVGAFEVPTTQSGELWVHYTQPVSKRIIPAWRILSGELSGKALAEAVEGRILFIGSGAIGLRDLVATPIQDRDLGTVVHAQMAEQMIAGHFLVRPDWAKGLEITLLMVLGIGLAVLLPRIGALRGALLGLTAIAALSAASWYAFSARFFLLDPIWPTAGVAAAWLTQTVLAFYREERQRAYIHHAFDRYLSPELVKRIADDPHLLELGGVEREMSILFCDIRNFSRISERFAPSETIGFMVKFLTPMSDLLLEHKATIDKYIGDAILAFWNAPLDDPDHRRNCARAALAMQRKLKAMNERLLMRGDGTWPGNVRIGVGLNSGPCCVGNIGSERRLSYSLIGDSVNLASRLEGLSKYYGVEILAGEELVRHLPGFATVQVDKVRVVGRDTPLTVHALLGEEPLAADAGFRDFAACHANMLDAYFGRRWSEAAERNDANEQAASAFGLTTLIMLYRDRLVKFSAEEPPADWDGVFEAQSK